MYASYESFIAVSGLLAEQPLILCLGCRTNAPEEGCDHCTACIDALNTNDSVREAA